MSYPLFLGRFETPKGAKGLMKVKYIPETVPTVIPGSLNPWADARAQQVITGEAQAWSVIQAKTARVKTTEKQIRALVDDFNSNLAALSKHLDQNMGQPLIWGSPGFTGTTDLITKIVFPPLMLPGFDILGKMISGVFGIGKKAKPVKEYVDMLVKNMQQDQAKIQAKQSQLLVDVDALRQAVQTGAAVRTNRDAIIAQQSQMAETAYSDQRNLDNRRAAMLRQQIEESSLTPRRSVMYASLI
ncbi:MAG: hypothetical protein ACRDL7_00060 [Gaiellaceae bacterium]